MDLTGQRFGKLEVLGRVYVRGLPPTPGGWWRCHCDCGREVVTAGENVPRGRPCSQCQDVEQALAAQARFASTHAGTPGWRGSGWHP
jgi:hypothetical protein